MKQITSFLLALSAALFSAIVPANAQRYNPTEPWPYLYEDFRPGNIFTNKESTIGYRELNVNVINGRLHFIDNGMIMEANMMNIHVVGIEEDVYLNVGGRLMRLLREGEHCAVVLGTEVDYDEMAKSNIGYGRSAVASTQDVSLMSLEGSNNNNKSLLEAQKTKYNGKVLPLRQTTYLVVDGRLYPTDRQSLLKESGVDRKVMSDFFKAEKIRLKQQEDLEKVGEFIHNQTN